MDTTAAPQTGATTIHDTTCEAERIPQDRRTAGCGCQDRATEASIEGWVAQVQQIERSAAA